MCWISRQDPANLRSGSASEGTFHRCCFDYTDEIKLCLGCLRVSHAGTHYTSADFALDSKFCGNFCALRAPANFESNFRKSLSGPSARVPNARPKFRHDHDSFLPYDDQVCHQAL